MMNRACSIASFLALMAALLVSLPATADVDAGDDDEKIEEVDNVELVQVVQAVSSHRGQAQSEGYTITSVYGRLHPALVHLPIGFLVMLFLLEVFGRLRPSDGAKRLTFVALAATFFSTLPSLLSGFLRTSEMWPASPPPELLADHRLMMILVGVLVAMALAVRVFRKNRLEGIVGYIYMGLLIGAVVLAGIGGHLGGKLVFGPQHLPF